MSRTTHSHQALLSSSWTGTLLLSPSPPDERGGYSGKAEPIPSTSTSKISQHAYPPPSSAYKCSVCKNIPVESQAFGAIISTESTTTLSCQQMLRGNCQRHMQGGCHIAGCQGAAQAARACQSQQLCAHLQAMQIQASVQLAPPTMCML